MSISEKLKLARVQNDSFRVSDVFNFISGHRRIRRSTTNDDAEVSGDSERGDRTKRYGTRTANYPQAMGGGYPAAGQGQGYNMNSAQGMAGPVGGGGGATGADYGEFPQREENDLSTDEDYSSTGSAVEGDGTISAKGMFLDMCAHLGNHRRVTIRGGILKAQLEVY